VIFALDSVYVLYYIDWFMYVDPLNETIDHGI
jgi:hypothetical protein